MPYKIVDSDRLDSKLTELADKLRAKNGTTEGLDFFKGEFSEAVDNIESPKEEQEKVLTVTENGSYEIVPDTGKVLSKATVKVAVPIKEEQKKDLTITENGPYKLVPDENHLFSEVNVDVDVNSDVWEEDTSEIATTYTANGNANISAYITENGTVTWKRNGYTQTGQMPKTAWSNMDQLINSFSTISGYWFSAKQAEVVNEPETEEAYLIKEIGDNAFSCLWSMRKVRLPDTITKIGNYAFFECKNLKQIALPNSVTNIANSAFRSCGSLEEFTIPPLVKTLGEYTFSGCNTMKKINGIDRIESIGGNCFNNNCCLQSTIVINEAVPNLASNTFLCCVSLDEIVFRGIPTVSSSCFSKCSNISKITIPPGWNKDLYINMSNKYSQEVLHAIIENFADMTGQTPIVFKAGSTNLNKVDASHIEMLNSKNIDYS